MSTMAAPYENSKWEYLDEVSVPIETDLERASDAVIKAMAATLGDEDPYAWAQEVKYIADNPDERLGVMSQNEEKGISLAVDKSFAIARVGNEGVYALRTPLLLYLLGVIHPDVR